MLTSKQTTAEADGNVIICAGVWEKNKMLEKLKFEILSEAVE